ncbi:MAG: hypoxanthine phosphoribosyltransferase [Gemmataceae bacterium]|nr:hypoxanthine phosphoribosyltransferase [Gemmataceae bacterium]
MISEEEIQSRVEEMGRQIAADFNGQPITVVGVLTGCLVFVADLIRQMDFPVRLCFVRASSYRGTTTVPGNLTIDSSFLPDVEGRDILLVDDILDSGQTLKGLMEHLREKGCASIRTAVLLRKKGKQQYAIEPDYRGFDIPDTFVVGYGLDFNDEYRNYPYLGILE